VPKLHTQEQAMNAYNTAFKKRVDKASLAMTHLIKQGCAITGLSIQDTSTVINILPPRDKRVKGTLISITGTHTGRCHMMATRLYGCTVQWHLTNEEPQQELNA
tara:strand:- start:29 stop:340 length:312 start_codon:yes stop_codon:yes gene_type:complete